MEYLRRDNIDNSDWDDLVRRSGSMEPYHYSWYLDIMSPGWAAMADRDNTIALPLPARRKWGIDYIATPVFLQKLNLYTTRDAGEGELTHMLNSIPSRYRLIDLSLSEQIEGFRGKVFRMQNNTLNLEGDYSALQDGYSGDARRNIRLAGEEDQEIVNRVEPSEAIRLFREGPGRKTTGISESDFSRLEELMGYTIEKGIGSIEGVRRDGRLIFSIFYIDWLERITLLFTSTSSESRLLRSGYLLTDNLVSRFAGNRKELDFAGSSFETVSRYNRSYGAVEGSYYRYYRRRVPLAGR